MADPESTASTQSGVVFVYTTFGDLPSAEAVCGRLVQDKLAACANLYPGVTSIYEWQGKLATDSECTAFLKTRVERQKELVSALKAAHPYETPAVLVLPASDCDRDFLEWIKQQTAVAG